MRLAFLATVVLGVSVYCACGGADPLPPPPPPPPAMPQAKAGSALAQADAAVDTPPEAPVLLVPGAPAPETAGPAPSLKLVAPTRGQVIADATKASIKIDVKNWPLAKGSAHIALVLDGNAAGVIDDPKAPRTLASLANGSLAEGQHVLAAALARSSGETIKTKEAVVVIDFYVGKKTAATVDIAKPYLVMTSPDVSYEGARADHVLVDFHVTGAPVADGKDRVALQLEGPGVQGIIRTTTPRLIPYYLENLHAGTYTLRGELLDESGKALTNPGATLTRTITVKRAEAAPPVPAPGSGPASVKDTIADAGKKPDAAR